MSDLGFFISQTRISEVKTSIVLQYFYMWQKVIIAQVKKSQGAKKIAYIDLFCGPGEYEDGCKSTPVKILELALKEQDLTNMLVTLFNDKDYRLVERLIKNISLIPDINKLRHKPIVENTAIGDETIQRLQKISMVPSFIFIDPWGYKGLSIDLISAVIKDWGCDCLIFFNYNRINAAITNKMVSSNIIRIFGESKSEELRKKLPTLKPSEREKVILESFYQAINEKKNLYSIAYKFYSDKGKVSHFLIFF